MRRLVRFGLAAAMVVVVGAVSACQRTVEVQTGTRIVDAQGRVISEDIQTLRVPPESASAYRINTITQESTSSPQIAALYADAQSAIAAGDLKTAGQKLAEVIALDASFGKAKQQADAIAKGEKVKPDTSNPTSNPKPSTPSTTTGTPGGKPPVENGSALTRWTPDVLTGFTAAVAAVDPLSVSRQYTPNMGNPASSLVIVAEQFRNSTAAKRALKSNVKDRYPDNSSSSTVNGHTVYFGTDGKFAVAGFTDGAVMVALEASPRSGSASSMKSVLSQAVEQLP